ncbi:unnamed protein product [Brassica oleracea]|uniref:(rape) hypothetical protein n=1 Tax=Brassica napus TaxID=3708 RepID=A0A816Q1P5_BRANA|nr:unnamed protein product [Brassica napus]
MFWVRLWIVVMSKIFSVPGESNKKKLEFTVSDIKINDDDKTLTSFQSNEDTQEDNDKQVDQSEKRGQSDKWLLIPTKSIQEMITST